MKGSHQVGLLLLLTTTPVQAADCGGFIQKLSEYLKAWHLNGLSTIVTTNQGARAFSSHTQIPLIDQGAYLVGSGQQYISERTYYTAPAKAWVPFNPQATDSLQIFIYKSPAKIEFKLNSWNGNVISSTPSCEGSVMFGTFNGGDSVYSLSFNKYQQVPDFSGGR